jgi:hypothetical protein
MNYRGVLTVAEAQEFFRLFYEIEIGRRTVVHQHPVMNGTAIEVFLNPLPIAAPHLADSFNVGLLDHVGWSEKFEEDDDYATIMKRRLLTGKTT